MVLKKIGPTGALVNGKESKSLALVTPVACGKTESGRPCKHCAFHRMGGKKPLLDELMHEFNAAFSDPQNVPPKTNRVELLSYGSLLDPEYLPLDFVLKIVALAARSGYTEIIVETRPEHITEEIVLQLVENAGNSLIRFAMGIESWDDRVRNSIIGKDISQEDIYRVMILFERYGAGAWWYTFLKPLGLTESEAVKDCVNTVRGGSLAFPDVDIVFALQPAFIAEGSDFHRKAYAANYLPPFLWSVIEFLKRVHSAEFIRQLNRKLPPKIFIGLNDESLSSNNYVKNCPDCSDRIYHLLDEDYNRTQNLGLFDGIDCACKSDWEDVFLGKKEETYDNSVSPWNMGALKI